MTRKAKPTSSQICSQRKTAKHPADAAQWIIDQIPNEWESDSQYTVVKTVIKTALPPPRPKDILRSATILRVSRVIDKKSHRLVWRYIAANRTHFGEVKNKPKEKEYPIYFAISNLYSEGRQYDNQGVEAVRLVTRLAMKLPPKATFSGEMYYRHVLALRATMTSYWKHAKVGKRQ